MARRLALSRRVIVELPGLGRTDPSLGVASGSPAGSIALSWAGPPPEGAEEIVRAVATAHRRSGGVIDLERPDRRIVLAGAGEDLWVGEVVSEVDRRSYQNRRMPSLPFQRPVSLHPRLARAAVNLARISPGARVVDPFLGTGALLLEAGLLGARLYGVDIDARMVQGAERNLAAFNLHAEAIRVGDAQELAVEADWPTFDAIVTDPPYGRASSTRGESPPELLARIVPRWTRLLRPGGHLVLIGPSFETPADASLELVASLQERVHRSLTRYFQAYRKVGDARSAA
ncbi:MAG TPA: RsmD family RNA methyltransferase [Thermoplasmata archaeon]|nr:RsmD family RNA methyltransferase [Thermoplasmata archaeon]